MKIQKKTVGAARYIYVVVENGDINYAFHKRSDAELYLLDVYNINKTKFDEFYYIKEIVLY